MDWCGGMQRFGCIPTMRNLQESGWKYTFVDGKYNCQEVWEFKVNGVENTVHKCGVHGESQFPYWDESCGESGKVLNYGGGLFYYLNLYFLFCK